MDSAQSWILSNWVTLSAATLMVANITLACFAYKKFLIFGAIGLLCSWVGSIGVFLIARGGDLVVARLIVDTLAVMFFYRLAERDRHSGERHDWAALICFAYVFLVILDLRELLFGAWNPKLFRASANVIFFGKIAVNMAPSISIILRGRPVLR